jgi:glucosamine--fructose-6-phosphate aminotransferase (isomerizing)
MSVFVRENEQLAEALEALLDYYAGAGSRVIGRWREMAKDRAHILFCGMGTSEFTPLAVTWRLARMGVACSAVDAGEWYHYGPQTADGTSLAVLTSQSGESVEMRRLVTAGRLPRPFVAITNNETSTLGQAAALSLPLCAGREESITTKTYTNNLAILHLMARALESEAALQRAFADLHEAAKSLAAVDEQALEDASRWLAPGDGIAFVARGSSVVCAKQCALTFMEGTRCLTSAFSGGAFNHGPFESVGPDFRLVVFAPLGKTHDLLLRVARDAAGHGAHVVVFSDGPRIQGAGIVSVEVPRPEAAEAEDLFPIAVARSHNDLLNRMAVLRGLQTGQFRYGGKVTSRE